MSSWDLSNDLGKVDSNFFRYAAAVLSPHRNVSFLHRKCINLHEGCLRNKMHNFTLHFERVFFCVKSF